jgi:hypothetical protein
VHQINSVSPQSCPREKIKIIKSMGYLITSLNIYFWGKKKGRLSFVIFSQMGDSENFILFFKQ